LVFSLDVMWVMSVHFPQAGLYLTKKDFYEVEIWKSKQLGWDVPKNKIGRFEAYRETILGKAICCL